MRLRLGSAAADATAAAGSRRLDLVTALLFAGCVVLAASNFVAVRYSNLDLPPLWGAGLRFGLAAVSYAVLVQLLKLPWLRREDMRDVLVYGVLNFGAFYALTYWALLHVTAGTAAVVIGAVPLITLLLAVAQGLERLSARTLIGGTLALLGVGWLTATSSAIAATPLALLALVVAAVCLGQSIVVGKRVSRNHPASLNAVGMAVGAALLLAISVATGETWALPSSMQSVIAVVYLVTFGSMGLFGLTILLLRRWAPSASSYVLVVVPLVTLLLESLIARVPVMLGALAGAVLVLAGTWFGALSRASPTRSAAPGEPDLSP
ncbi:MAG TPA: EamA family transporter [Trueperaceae bacterium]